MCSVNDDESDAIIAISNGISDLDLNNANCKKCIHQKADVILRKKDPYCQSCFVSGVVHKFRASLGKTKIIRNGDKVLLAVSGDAASSVLIDLVKTGLKESTHKKIRFQPLILYIDESIILNNSLEEKQKHRKLVYDLLQTANMPMYATSLSNILKTTSRCSAFTESFDDINNDTETNVKSLFASTKSLTTMQDLLRKLKQRLLLNCAEELNCSFIFVAETATKLAANLISCVSLGGGSHLSSDVGFCDSRANIKILRPMRDFTSDDLDLYININKIKYVPQRSLVNVDNPYASIQSLTKKFVNDLQESFPATISTILRTGDKMENKTGDSEENTCAMCLSQLDTEHIACSALDATTYSRMISNVEKVTLRDSEDNNQEESCNECNCKSTDQSCITQSEIIKFLCYNCQLLLRDIKDIDSLLPSLTSTIRLKKSQECMKNQIQDYLL